MTDHTPGHLLWVGALVAWLISDRVFWWRQRKRFRKRYENYQGGAPFVTDWTTMNDRERRHTVGFWLLAASSYGALWLIDRLGL